MFVYVIVNSETLKIYVGQHKGTNLRKYLQTKLSNAKRNSGTRSHLVASMRKHPKEVWSIHPLLSDLQTREECDEWERHYIKVLKAQHPDIGYNICRGGEGHPTLPVQVDRGYAYIQYYRQHHPGSRVLERKLYRERRRKAVPKSERHHHSKYDTDAIRVGRRFNKGVPWSDDRLAANRKRD